MRQSCSKVIREQLLSMTLWSNFKVQNHLNQVTLNLAVLHSLAKDNRTNLSQDKSSRKRIHRTATPIILSLTAKAHEIGSWDVHGLCFLSGFRGSNDGPEVQKPSQNVLEA